MKKEWSLGEGEATFQKGVTAHAEGQPLLEQKGRQGLGGSQVRGGKKSALRDVCGCESENQDKEKRNE